MTYDQDYLIPEYFGDPFPELLAFFEHLPSRGLVIDMGCGQGRNALPLARMGFEVVGLDLSSVGVTQMIQTAKAEGLSLQGIVTDIYAYTVLHDVQAILLDSMFHFQERDREKESAWIRSLFNQVQSGTLVVFCIQDSGKKVSILEGIISKCPGVSTIHDEPMTYTFKDAINGHQSVSDYRLIVVQT